MQNVLEENLNALKIICSASIIYIAYSITLNIYNIYFVKYNKYIIDNKEICRIILINSEIFYPDVW